MVASAASHRIERRAGRTRTKECSGHANLAASQANMAWCNGLRDFCDKKEALH